MDAYGYYSYDESAIMAVLGVYLIVILVIGVLTLAGMWKMFTKAGLAGWKCIIPIYNLYCLCKITWGTGWVFLAYIIPIVSFVISIMTSYKLAKAFGKGIGFTLGLIFLPTIFYIILGFGKAEYTAPEAV
ncbi:DUF5684 domain-containing protein [Konateibacter massiliensis]|uniref:DUF5684 domain-containing protein n=1 Tax=Konateibacter massiliensis TaxID=2002841 RepID=UPI001F363C35|nr:DUF5684 domain-containing protein [Konateibacter massiliensis]